MQQILSYHVIMSAIKTIDDFLQSVQDALACLASEEIKLASLKNKADEDEGVTEEDMRGALVAAAKKTIISQVCKSRLVWFYWI